MTPFRPNPDILALGVRQPWAELILRGVKTIEVRSQNTRVRGPIYLYASKKFSNLTAAIDAAQDHGLDCLALPTGFLVGSVEIADSRPAKARDATAACVPAAFLKTVCLASPKPGSLRRTAPRSVPPVRRLVLSVPPSQRSMMGLPPGPDCRG